MDPMMEAKADGSHGWVTKIFYSRIFTLNRSESREIWERSIPLDDGPRRGQTKIRNVSEKDCSHTYSKDGNFRNTYRHYRVKSDMYF